MPLFLLDCDSVSSTGSTLESISKQLSNIGSTISSYDTNCNDGFDFASAKAAIAKNIEATTIKIDNASKLVAAVVKSHTELQNKLIYGKKEESKNNTNNNGNGNRRSGGGSGRSGGSGGGYPSMSGFAALSSELTSDELAKLRELMGANVIEVTTQVKRVTCTAVDNLKLTEDEKAIFENTNFAYNSNGYAMIENRYVISCDKSFGKVGDAITIIKKDGTTIDCIIGHVTDDETSRNIVNFYVDPLKWKASNKDNITVDLAKDVSKVYNGGKVKLKDGAKIDSITDNSMDSKNTNNIETSPSNAGNDTSTTDVNTGNTSSETNNTGASSESSSSTTTESNPNIGVGTDKSPSNNPLKSTIDKAREIINNKNNSNNNTDSEIDKITNDIVDHMTEKA